MLIVLSPAKSLDYKTPAKPQTLPEFVAESAKLIAELKKLVAARDCKSHGFIRINWLR